MSTSSGQTNTVDLPSDSESPDEPMLYTLAEAAEKLRISYWVMYRLARDRAIPSVYQGRCRYVSPQALRDYVANLPTAPSAEKAYKR